MKKIAIFSNTLWSIINFRKSLIVDLQKENFNITIIAPKDGYVNKFEHLNVNIIYLQYLNINNKNPIKEVKLLFELRKILIKEKFDFVLSYTIKPNLYNAIASFGLKQKNFATINGLGFSFAKINFFNKIVTFLYRFSLLNVSYVFFQNIDDKSIFIDKKIINHAKAKLVDGSGISLEDFPLKRTFFNIKERRIFVYCARLIKEKGIVEYMEAAREIKKEFPLARFLLYGIISDNPNAISLEQMNSYILENSIEYKGKTDDINDVLENADIVVMPSFYREGIPRFLLEALSKGLPIITTNSVGCKEVIDNNENGILIKPRDKSSLINACKKLLIIDDIELKNLGSKSRILAKTRFSSTIINNHYIDTIKELM